MNRMTVLRTVQWARSAAESDEAVKTRQRVNSKKVLVRRFSRRLAIPPGDDWLCMGRV
jgi:hypothetical protein